MRALRPQNRLLILLAHASLWQTFTTEELREWTRTLAARLRRQGCTLLILSHGGGINKLKGQLSAQHRILNGLSSLQWQQDSAQYSELVEHRKRHQCQSAADAVRRGRRLAG